MKSRCEYNKSMWIKSYNSLPCVNHDFLYIVGNQAKGRISKWVFQENKARQSFRKTNISYPLIRTRTRTCAYQGKRNVCFLGKFGAFCFLETPILRFALLPDYQQYGAVILKESFIPFVIFLYYFKDASHVTKLSILIFCGQNRTYLNKLLPSVF